MRDMARQAARPLPDLGRLRTLGALALCLALAGSACTSAGSASPGSGASPGASSASPTASPSPSPTPVDVAARFIATMAQRDLATTMDVTGGYLLGKLEFAVTGSMQGHGADSASSLTMTGAGTTITSESISLAGESWSRTAPGPWMAKPASTKDEASLSQSLAALVNLEDAGIVTKAGRRLHHLVPPGGFSIPPTALGLTDPAIVDPAVTVDFYATDDGKAAIMSVTAAWSMTVAGSTIPAKMTLDFAFRTIGKGVVITAPTDVWTTATSTKWGYSIAHPSDWDLTAAVDGDWYQPERGAPAIYVSSMKIGDATLSEFRAEMLSGYSANAGWKKLAEPAQTTLGGQPAWILTYQGKNATGAFVIHQLVSVNAGKGWVVMVFDEPGFETEDQALLRAAVATFHFAR